MPIVEHNRGWGKKWLFKKELIPFHKLTVQYVCANMFCVDLVPAWLRARKRRRQWGKEGWKAETRNLSGHSGIPVTEAAAQFDASCVYTNTEKNSRIWWNNQLCSIVVSKTVCKDLFALRFFFFVCQKNQRIVQQLRFIEQSFFFLSGLHLFSLLSEVHRWPQQISNYARGSLPLPRMGHK